MGNRILITLGVLIGVVSTLGWYSGGFGQRIDYNADVKPILNKNCMGCHGGVKKAGNVSFLFEDEMLKPGKSGKVPVVRGDADASEMIRRILSHDPDERMPKQRRPPVRRGGRYSEKLDQPGGRMGNALVVPPSRKAGGTFPALVWESVWLTEYRRNTIGYKTKLIHFVAAKNAGTRPFPLSQSG